MSPGNSCKICRHASIAVSRTPDPRGIGNWCRLEYNCPSTLAPEGSAVKPSPARFAPLQIGFEKAGLIGAKKMDAAIATSNFLFSSEEASSLPVQSYGDVPEIVG